MRMSGFPLYCGGRLLLGIYNIRILPKRDRRGDNIYPIVHEPQYTDDELFKIHIEKNLSSHPDTNTASQDPVHFICEDVLLNQKLLCECVTYSTQDNRGKLRLWHSIGTIVAVTNSSQTNAEKFLEASGFEVVATTSKYSDRTDIPQCKTWVGDFQRKIKPILKPIAISYFEGCGYPKSRLEEYLT